MTRTLHRRQVLRGAAGFTLGLPLLASLEPKGASAQTVQQTPRFVAFATQHGGIWAPNMFPGDNVLTASQNYAGHEIRRGALSASLSGGVARLSEVLKAPDTVLTDDIIAKMNVIRGLDVSFYIGHHTGGHLGNYARNDGNGGDGGTVGGMPRQTIDQVLAWSDTFYDDLASTLERSMVIGNGRMSYGWSSPQTQSGEIQEVNAETSSLDLFNRIFVPEEDPEEKRPPIVDRVLEDYRRLRNGNRRLSAADRQRLDDHLERLDELERKLNVLVSCGDVPVPTSDSQDETGGSFNIDPDAQRRFWQLFNDVIVAAFICGTSRIATINVGSTFSSFAGDWHQDVAHQANLADGNAQAIISNAHQLFFQDVYMDLVTKLDAVIEYEDLTLLDASLVQWTQESGAFTHDSISTPVVTAGGGAGEISTGGYIDYRNLDRVANDGGVDVTYTGLCYNQYLSNVLQAMGLPPAEFEEPGVGGYGVLFESTETWYGAYNNYNNAVFANMNDALPYFKI